DVGLGGDELDAEAGLDAQHLEGLLGAVGRAGGRGLADEGAGTGAQGEAQRAGSDGAADQHDFLHSTELGVRSRFGRDWGQVSSWRGWGQVSSQNLQRSTGET